MVLCLPNLCRKNITPPKERAASRSGARRWEKGVGGGGRKTTSLSNATGRKQEARKLFQTADVAVPPWRWKMGRGAHAPAPEEESVSLPPPRVQRQMEGWACPDLRSCARGREASRQATPLGPFPFFLSHGANWARLHLARLCKGAGGEATPGPRATPTCGIRRGVTLGKEGGGIAWSGNRELKQGRSRSLRGAAAPPRRRFSCLPPRREDREGRRAGKIHGRGSGPGRAERAKQLQGAAAAACALRVWVSAPRERASERAGEVGGG